MRYLFKIGAFVFWTALIIVALIYKPMLFLAIVAGHCIAAVIAGSIEGWRSVPPAKIRIVGEKRRLLPRRLQSGHAGYAERPTDAIEDHTRRRA